MEETEAEQVVVEAELASNLLPAGLLHSQLQKLIMVWAMKKYLPLLRQPLHVDIQLELKLVGIFHCPIEYVCPGWLVSWLFFLVFFKASKQKVRCGPLET